MTTKEMIDLEYDNFLKKAKTLVLEIMEKKKSGNETTIAEENFKDEYINLLVVTNAKNLF